MHKPDNVHCLLSHLRDKLDCQERKRKRWACNAEEHAGGFSSVPPELQSGGSLGSAGHSPMRPLCRDTAMLARTYAEGLAALLVPLYGQSMRVDERAESGKVMRVWMIMRGATWLGRWVLPCWGTTGVLGRPPTSHSHLICPSGQWACTTIVVCCPSCVPLYSHCVTERFGGGRDHRLQGYTVHVQLRHHGGNGTHGRTCLRVKALKVFLGPHQEISVLQRLGGGPSDGALQLGGGNSALRAEGC